MSKTILAIAFLSLGLTACADYPTEPEWAIANAERYEAENEVVQWEGSRIDYTTKDFVYEIDWAKKWHEGVGQALWYAILVPDKKPGLILLVKDKDKELKYCLRAQAVCAKYDIKLVIEQVEEK